MEISSLAQMGALMDKKRFFKLYLFYGNEDYLISLYTKKIIAENCGADFDRIVIPKGAFSPRRLAEAALTCPIGGGKRVITVEDSAAFSPKKGPAEGKAAPAPKKRGGKATAEGVTVEACLEQIPDTAIVIFLEKSADKRLSAYKAAAKTGLCAELKKPDQKTLVNWVVREAKTGLCAISPANAAYFTENCGTDMHTFSNELKKLTSYASGEITKADIDAICSKTLESSVFALTDAVGERNAALAITLLGDLIALKTSPFFILVMLFNQFKSILTVKTFEKQADAGEIAKKTGLAPFTVIKARGFAKNFSAAELENALNICLETDVKIKSGRVPERLGVESVILETLPAR